MGFEENGNKIFESVHSEFKKLFKRANNATLRLDINSTSAGYYDVSISAYSDKYKKRIEDTRFSFSIFDDKENLLCSFINFINSFENNYLKKNDKD